MTLGNVMTPSPSRAPRRMHVTLTGHRRLGL